MHIMLYLWNITGWISWDRFDLQLTNMFSLTNIIKYGFRPNLDNMITY